MRTASNNSPAVFLPASKRKLWVVSELYYPEYTATGHLLTVIAEGLAEHYDVRVLTVHPTYAMRGVKTPKHEIHNGVSIYRCWATAANKDNLFLRFMNLTTISCSLFLQCLLRFKRGERVLVVTNPPMLPLLVSVACRWKRANCVLLAHDIYPEIAVLAGVIRPHSWFVWFWNAAIRRAYRSMKRIAVLGRDMQEVIRKKRGKSPEAVRVITNWGDVDQVYPLPREENPLLGEFGLLDKFVVQYGGNIGWIHDVDVLVKTAELLRDEPDMQFFVLGTGRRMQELEQLVSERQLRNFTITSMRPRNEALLVHNACDVAISVFVPGMYGLAVPSRMYNIFASAKPLIAVTDSGSEMARVIEEEQVGWVVPPGNSAAFAQALREARDRAAELPAMGRRAREVVLRKYTPEKIIASFVDLFDGIDAPPEPSH
ncbi:MAG: glycosyltransferase family 4 protein [Thermoguttaceae bacterium]|jgi:glycosyltransferase involved in cell wall biosynthesis